MPFDRAKLHFTKPEDDGEVVEPERPSKIRRVTGPNSRVIYEL